MEHSSIGDSAARTLLGIMYICGQVCIFLERHEPCRCVYVWGKTVRIHGCVQTSLLLLVFGACSWKWFTHVTVTHMQDHSWLDSCGCLISHHRQSECWRCFTQWHTLGFPAATHFVVHNLTNFQQIKIGQVATVTLPAVVIHCWFEHQRMCLEKNKRFCQAVAELEKQELLHVPVPHVDSTHCMMLWAGQMDIQNLPQSRTSNTHVCICCAQDWYQQNWIKTPCFVCALIG